MREPRSTRKERLLRFVMHRYWRVARGMTLGVRAVIIDDEERVFLVRHGYTPGWHLPGGGVEPGETTIDSVIREVEEEANIRPAGPILLHGIFYNRLASSRDHVAVYVLRDFVVTGPRPPDREIVECGFFPVSRLPAGTTEGTRQRIEEVMQEAEPSPYWSG